MCIRDRLRGLTRAHPPSLRLHAVRRRGPLQRRAARPRPRGAGRAPGVRREPDPGHRLRRLPRLPGGRRRRGRRAGARPAVSLAGRRDRMHIPDGYLGPQTYAVLDVVMIPIWIIAARKVKRTLKAKQIPLMALGAAFSFVIMMFNVPVIGGSTGHAVGATLIAIILGPWAAVIAISIALVIQAGLFGDGGITAIGANCFNMAVVAPFVGYYLFRLVAGDSPSASRRVVASGVAAYVALVAAAIVAGVEFGIQPYLAHTAGGQALYAPYTLGGLWRSAMPGYATPGISNALLGYLIAAVVGTALTVGVADLQSPPSVSR